MHSKDDRPQMRSARLVFALVLSFLMISATAFAGKQRFDCVLTDTAEQLASENHAVSIVLDETTKTLKAQDGSRSYSFNKVAISALAISGEVDNASIGIDRSSWGIVWQQYNTDKVVTQFGRCRQSKVGG